MFSQFSYNSYQMPEKTPMSMWCPYIQHTHTGKNPILFKLISFIVLIKYYKSQGVFSATSYKKSNLNCEMDSQWRGSYSHQKG